MQIQSKSVRRNAAALFLGMPIFIAGQCIGDDSANSKGKKGSQVPAYVAAHFDKAKLRTVHGNKAVVRSGPSDKYYPTSTLVKGAVVEVYMETSDGWSAIRPPAGSHNWIPANVAYLLPGGKGAEITQDKTPAWVGSDSSDVSDFMWQLELIKSQQVQVLGEETQLTEDGKKQLWYRISPPQGEFRWVKNSQLSDSLPSASKDSSVQLANYVDEKNAVVPADKGKSESGKVVWSDEKQSLEQVESQIRREQLEIQRKMEADGIKVPIESPKLEVKQSGAPFKLASQKSASNRNPEPESVIADSTRIHPIAESSPPRRDKVAIRSAEHQVDGDRQWEAMQSADPKLRIKPMRSVLGLLGFSIIEADRAPVSTHIAQQYHANAPAGNMGRIGPVGNSRLDRLPRPGNRPSMTLPTDGSETLHYPTEMEPMGWNGVQGESTFSKWLNSREPVFGSSQAGTNPMLATSGMQMAPPYNTSGQAYGAQPVASSLDTTAWHGLSPAQRNANAQPTVVSNGPKNASGNYAESDLGAEEVEEFRTPEIQSALVHLTREVAGPTEEWNFTALRGQAASWIENGATAMVRGEARLLMERIERFESLRQRTLGFAQQSSMMAQQAIGNAAANAVRQAGNFAPSAPASALGDTTGGSHVINAIATNATNQGDASGWLVQVHTTMKGQPEFALTDDVGKVIAYVQSYPSVNLRSYLQQPVTIYGVRGYIPNLAAKQILAERVVRMR